MDTITWRDRFQLPHETNWSLHQKKCFVDAYTVKPLPGTGSSLNHSQQIYIGDKIATRGRYCPECAKHGYHAWFHQLICFDHCVMHPDQPLVNIEYPLIGEMKESFFQQIGTRAIDLMVNEDFRYEIEAKIHPDFDRIAVIDIMDHKYGAQSSFRSMWYRSTLQTMGACCSGKVFATARKVATIPSNANKHIAEWVEKYLKDSVFPWFYRQMEVRHCETDYAFEESNLTNRFRHLDDMWKQWMRSFPIESINLIMHKAFFVLCEQIGGVEKYEMIINSIHNKVFDAELCDFHTYGKVITLILSSHYCCASHLEQLYRGSRYVAGIPDLSSKLDFYQIDMDQFVNIRSGNYRNMEVPIIAAILDDVLSYTASVLGNLMAEKRCLTGGRTTSDIYSSFFCLPVSQYIAVWNAGTVDLWACDPDFDALLNNIKQAEEHFKKTSRLSQNHILEPV